MPYRRLTALALLASIPGAALAQGYICAEGGGNPGKGAWADEVFGWMVEKGGRGPVVILGTSKLDGDERIPLFQRLGAASVTSLNLDKASANTEATYDAIAAARIVFLRGGAQDTYVQNWKGAKTQEAIIHVFKSGGVIAGTSAGCAVLGEVVYDALHGSLSAEEALRDSRHESLSLTTGFLDLVPGVLFDTHFTERARIARLPVMLAHCKQDLHLPDILGIGVDPRTAVCIGPDGIAEIRGEGTATFLILGPATQIALDKGQPPGISAISYTQLCAGYRYDLHARAVLSRPPGILPTDEPASLSAAPKDPITIDGADRSAPAAGQFQWTIAHDDDWLRGQPTPAPGRSDLPGQIVAPLSWQTHDHASQLAALETTLAQSPGMIGYCIPGTMTARFERDGTFRPAPKPDQVPESILILDGRKQQYGGRGPAPRRAPAVEGAVLHLLAPTSTFNITTGAVSENLPAPAPKP